jgi:hypothetical protein
MAASRRASADGAQLRMDLEVFNLRVGELPDKIQVAVKRLRREATLAGPEAERLAELLRGQTGQGAWPLSRFSREAEDGIPVVVQIGRRRGQQGQRARYGFTLTPRVEAGEIAIEAELRTGKQQPDLCEPEVRSYALKVSLGGYAAFWLTALQAGEPDTIAIARFHPSE